MAENRLKTGYLKYKGRNFVFTYDGELLQLVPKNKVSNELEFLQRKTYEFDILEGVTVNKEKICFLKGQLIGNNFGFFAKPSGYLCFNDEMDNFHVITFKGGIINYFYRANHIVDNKETMYDYRNGSAVLKLKTFEETTKEIDVEIAGKKAILKLSVTMPGKPINMEIDYNLGKPQSILRLEFFEAIEVSDFRNIYMWIYNLMVFVNFRKDISLGEIELGKKNEDNLIEKIGYTYLYEKDKKPISNIERIIGYSFIFKHLNELLQVVNRKDINLLFIPENEKEDRFISDVKYMVCCTSFESVFTHVFPDARSENDMMVKEVKNEFLQYIENKREEYKGKNARKRKEFKKYSDMIKRLDFGLAEKFNYCCDRFKNDISNYYNMLIDKMDISQKQLEELSDKFAEKRNLLMHSGVGEFENIHIFAYALARIYIYEMVLYESNIESEMRIQIIDKMF